VAAHPTVGASNDPDHRHRLGLIHQSPSFLRLAIVVGISAGWIRERTGSVVVTVAVHALQSAIIVGAVAAGDRMGHPAAPRLIGRRPRRTRFDI